MFFFHSGFLCLRFSEYCYVVLCVFVCLCLESNLHRLFWFSVNQHMFFHICVLCVCFFANRTSVGSFAWWKNMEIEIRSLETSQIDQSINSPVWTISCFFKLARWVKCFEQSLQPNGFSSEVKMIEITWRRYGYMISVFLHLLVWVTWCLTKLAAWENLLSQILHTWGFSPECTYICYGKMGIRLKGLFWRATHESECARDQIHRELLNFDRRSKSLQFYGSNARHWYEVLTLWRFACWVKAFSQM